MFSRIITTCQIRILFREDQNGIMACAAVPGTILTAARPGRRNRAAAQRAIRHTTGSIQGLGFDALFRPHEYLLLTYSTIVYIIWLIMASVLASLAVVLVILVAMGMMKSMAMRSYSRQAAIVTERRKRRKLP